MHALSVLLFAPMTNRLKRWRRYLEILGMRNGLFLLTMNVLRVRSAKRVHIGGIKLFIRPRSQDLTVAKSLILDKELGYIKCKEPRVIVDAGAYIGISSILFAREYPAAKVIALEPDDENYEILRKNVQDYRNIVPVKAALWTDDDVRTLFDPGTGPWGYTISEALGTNMRVRGQIKCLTLKSVMERYGLNHIDLLKLDIEGAEKELFECSDAWIRDVGVINVELHDFVRQGCSEAFDKATRGFVNVEKRGINVTVYNNENA